MKIDGATFKPELMDVALVNEVTLNNDAAVDFTNIGGYDQYVLVWNEVRPSADGESMQMRVSHDNGATFLSGGNDYKWSMRLSTSAGDGHDLDTADTEVQVTSSNASHDMGNDTGEANSGELWIHSLGKGGTFAGGTIHNGGTSQFPTFINSFGFWQYVSGSSGFAPPNPINAFRLFMTTGNLASGKMYLYGIRV